MKIKLKSVSGTFNQPFGANQSASKIELLPVVGTPTIRIGTTAGSDNVLLDTVLSTYLKIHSDVYFLPGGNLYFTFSGMGGEININIKVNKGIF